MALAILLPLAWGGVLLGSSGPEAILTGSLSQLARAYPPGRVREEIVEEARGVGKRFRPGVRTLGEAKSELIGAGLMATALHLGPTLRFLPLMGLLTLSGAGAGLLFRERIRIAEGYASPTAAGLARLGVGAGILWTTLYSLSPLPVSQVSLYAAAGILAGGGALYVANLPLKI